MLLAPLLLICLVLFVAWPLLREGSPGTVSIQDVTELDQAREEKDSAVENLKDIEMDFRMGKLSQDDYERLKEEWEVRAVDAIRNVEDLERQASRKNS